MNRAILPDSEVVSGLVRGLRTVNQGRQRSERLLDGTDLAPLYGKLVRDIRKLGGHAIETLLHDLENLVCLGVEVGSGECSHRYR